MAISLYAAIGNQPYDLKSQLALDLACQTLTMVLLAEIREKDGATYSIGAYDREMAYPKGQALVQIVYQTNPDKVEYTEGATSPSAAAPTPRS